MKLRFLALLACVLLPLQVVNADIASDLAAGLDIQTVLQNAVDQGMSIEAAVAEAVTGTGKSWGYRRCCSCDCTRIITGYR